MAILVGSVTGPAFGTVDQTAMYLSNLTEEHTSQEAELANGQGDPVLMAVFGRKGEISGDYEVRTTGFPGVNLHGHQLTISGDSNFAGTYIITQTSLTRQRGQWMTGKFKARVISGLDATWTTTTTTTTTTAA